LLLHNTHAQGDSLSTTELQVLLRVMNEAEVVAGADIDDALNRRSRARRKQQRPPGSGAGSGGRLPSSSALLQVPPGGPSAGDASSNSSVNKDAPYAQDTSSVRLRKRGARGLRARLQATLRRLRLLEAQQAAALQQREAQLRAWRGEGSSSSTAASGSPEGGAAAAASSSGQEQQRSSGWARAVASWGAAWRSTGNGDGTTQAQQQQQQQEQQQQQQQQQQENPSGYAVVVQLQGLLLLHCMQQQAPASGRAPVAVLVVPLQLLPDIERVWTEGSR
jgi:hypothetical protein